MPDFRLSKPAEADIANIAHYTIGQFGVIQARNYRNSLDTCFQSIVGNPRLGKSVDDIRKGYRRINHKSHVVFYKVEGRDILIIRILHKSMNAPQHL